MAQRERETPSQDEVLDTLANGTDDACNEIALQEGWSKKQLAAYRYHARLRCETILAMQPAIQERKRLRPVGTAEELAAGVYNECLEPQVRDAVWLLRRKGYSTIYSGFDHCFGQCLLLATERFAWTDDLRGLQQELKTNSIRFTMHPKAITLRTLRQLSLEAWQEVWTRIAELLPDLGTKAAEGHLYEHTSFRKQQAGMTKYIPGI